MGRGTRVAFIAIAGFVMCCALAAGVGWYLFQNAYGPDTKLEYRQVAGTALRLDVFKPETPSNKPAPAILFLHGGAWTTGAPLQFHSYAKHFSERGWFAASAQYRLYGTHGTNAFDALEDARAAYRYLLDNAAELNIDTSKLIVAGSSAGGHLAAAIAMVPTQEAGPLPQPAALALLNPALDTDFPLEHQIGRLFDGRGDTISPMHHVKANLPRTLVVHGTQDTIVAFADSKKFCKEMNALGNQCELSAHQGEGHGFWNWGSDKHEEVLEELVQFSAELE